jgi:hypothetical protein
VSGKFVNLLTSLAVLGLLAGCTSTNMTGMFKSDTKKDEAPADTANKPVVVQGACPLVFLREGTAVYTQYAKVAKKRKKNDPAAQPDDPKDPDNVVVQATLDQTTRQCFQTAQGLRITVVVHGRLVLGPAGKPGSSFNLPIRVAATDGDQTLYSELTQYPVALGPGQSTMQFVFTKENVALSDPNPSGLARLFAGIDEGPYNTK